ncbi:DUF2752 domain-containing protein [Galbibacter pacificus]
MLPCLNKKLFGVECLGCGIQRSVALIFQGEFMAAFKMYPAIYTLILLFIYLGFNNFYKIRYANKILVFLLVLNFAIIVGNYILKLTNQY